MEPSTPPAGPVRWTMWMDIGGVAWCRERTAGRWRTFFLAREEYMIRHGIGEPSIVYGVPEEGVVVMYCADKPLSLKGKLALESVARSAIEHLKKIQVK